MRTLHGLIIGLIAALISCIEAHSVEIKNGDFSLATTKSGGIALKKAGASAVALSDMPIRLAYKYAKDSSTIDSEWGYSHFKKLSDGKFLAIAKIKLGDGVRINVEDTYAAAQSGAFTVTRKVTMPDVPKSAIGNGFRSSFALSLPVSDNANVERFIPSIIYRDTAYMRHGAIATASDGGAMFVKESRAGMPLIMLHDSNSGISVGLLHVRPEISVGEYAGGGSPGEINSELKYGSLGYVDDHGRVSAVFNYPSIETPVTYEPGAGRFPTRNERFHLIEPTYEQSYSLAIIPGNYSGYNDAMVDIFAKAYELESPVIKKIDMESIYRQNIELLNAEWRSMGTGEAKAAGLPWSLDLPDGKNTEGVSFQMGFVGQQIAVGYHLYRYGLEHADPAMARKGEAIIDFWASNIIGKSYFPHVWWDPADNETAGRHRDYPSFLRCMTDGMESLLDACEYAAKHGTANESWETALEIVVSHLAERQNADGSFFRAYRTDGSVETGGDRNTSGTSKMNTHIPVRLLARMHKHTGDDRYREAALGAAKFAYDNFCSTMGKYVGGTPDNPNTVDKEAAIYALYCFNAAHDLTGDPAYLQAAEHAAMNAMSWTYCYDFAVPNRNEADKAKNPFSDGGVIGFSVIATGHSGADNFMAYTCHEMYRLHIKTGKRIYRDMALFLQHNTKLCTDYDGRVGYKYRAFLPEATNVADFAFRSVSLWLPWSSIVNIDPLLRIKDEYGAMDIDEISQ